MPDNSKMASILVSAKASLIHSSHPFQTSIITKTVFYFSFRYMQNNIRTVILSLDVCTSVCLLTCFNYLILSWLIVFPSYIEVYDIYHFLSLLQTETSVISVEQELASGSFCDTDESRDSPVNVTVQADKAPVFKNPNFVV